MSGVGRQQQVSAGLQSVLQAKLDTLIGRPSGLIETLPRPVQKRIKFLESLQDQYDAAVDDFDQEVKALEEKYNKIYAPLLEKRAAVVKGDLEAPADIQLEEGASGDETGPSGIPSFWLNVLRANPTVGERITEKDEQVLEYLIDVQEVDMADNENGSFMLAFHFAENPFFENKVLTKAYHMAEGSDEGMLERAEGTKIKWKPSKDVTVKVLKKKPKPGRGGHTGRPITKLEKVDSFFNFFSPPDIPEQADEVDEDQMEELQSFLEEDFEIGEIIQERLIPHAVSWYTGDAVEDDEDDEEDEDEDEDDEEEEEEDDEDDDDEEEEGSPDKLQQMRPGSEALHSDKQQPPECKQQ